MIKMIFEYEETEKKRHKETNKTRLTSSLPQLAISLKLTDSSTGKRLHFFLAPFYTNGQAFNMRP